MSRYKAGDKIVLEIISGEAYGDYLAGSKEQNWWFNAEGLERGSEPLSTYTEPLEVKIRRQAAEITRLLAENERLKKENKALNIKVDYYESYSDKHEEECEEEFNRGCNEAWELARKIILLQSQGGMNDEDYKGAFGSGVSETYVIKNYTYAEAAAKVAEWEKAKEEIKVGDVVSHEEKYGVVISEGTICFRGFTDDGTPFEWYKERCTKTGRHIDIDSFLKQIGGEQE